MKNNFTEILLLVVITIINIFFTSLPLLNILSYESSALNAVLFSLITGLYFLKNRGVFLRRQLELIFASALIPILILFISTILCQHCPLNDGIYFYLILSIPSIFVGLALASLSLFISDKFRYLVFFTIWLITILSFLPELYFNPQIYFYNPIFGYYPGVIYDQNIAITSELILYRLSNIFFSIVIITFTHFRKNVNIISKSIVLSVVVIFYILFFYSKSFLGFSTDINRIKSELTEEIITENFRIIIPSSISDKEKKLLEYQHEYYFHSIEELLNTKPDTKITSIIFKTGAQKKRLFGSANADVAKPWLNQIYINYDNYGESLKHELAHIFSAKFADGLLNLPSNYNPGLIEGFAMAVENNYDDFDIDYLAALACNNEFKISLSNLFSDFSFFSNASSLSYIYAGSFLKYLAVRYGWENIKQVYNGGDFKVVYNSDVETLEDEYYNYLDTLSIKQNMHTTNYYFGRLPLIKKFCARATAKELKYAGKLYSEKKYKSCSDIYFRVFNYSGTYVALVGYVQSKKMLGEEHEAISFLSNEIMNYENTAYFYYLELLLADLYALSNNKKMADEYYQKIINQNPHRRYLRSAEVKRDMLFKSDSTFNKYINDAVFKKDCILKNIIEKPTDSYLQSLTVLKIDNDDEYNILMDTINKTDKLYKFSSDTYFDLSKFTFGFLDYDEAIKYGELAKKGSLFEKKSIIIEHIKKIKWIKQKYSID